MEKSDIRELRKAVKAKDHIIDWVYALYVDSDNHPAWESVMKYNDLEESAQFRHLDLFQKVLSTRLGRDAFGVQLAEQNTELLALRSADGDSEEEFESFRDALLEGYLHTDPYYATLTRLVYDVPARAADGRKLEDGEMVYEALLLAICPAKLTKAALGFRGDEVAELERRWQIGAPQSGFLYPAFSDRTEDRNEVLIRSKTPDTEDFLNSLFPASPGEAALGEKMQQDLFSDLLSRMDVSLESAARISENMLEKAAEEDAPMLVEKETVRKIAEASGADVSGFDEVYEAAVGDARIAFDSVASGMITVKTDDALLKIPADRAELIETRTIDGRDYILIPADGLVTVNGASVRTGEEDE
ncbi:MAG: DUF4317 family protein [Lachnospiraceae bacterium]|nr:DUF4317 family protein [Lachnospiraceae bacterium]